MAIVARMISLVTGDAIMIFTIWNIEPGGGIIHTLLQE